MLPRLLTALLALFITLPAAADIVINEIRRDQAGADDDEYIEFYIDGSLSAAIGDYTLLVLGDGGAGSGVIEEVSDFGALGVTSTADGSFIVFHESTLTLTVDPAAEAIVTTLNFENSDNVTFLIVTDFTGSDGDDLDVDDDGVLDVTPWSAVIDAVALVGPAGDPADEFEYATGLGGVTIGPEGPFDPGHVYSTVDGASTFDFGLFGVSASSDDTPGATNASAVPEPGALSLAGLAGVVALLRRRRRAQ